MSMLKENDNFKFLINEQPQSLKENFVPSEEFGRSVHLIDVTLALPCYSQAYSSIASQPIASTAFGASLAGAGSGHGDRP